MTLFKMYLDESSSDRVFVLAGYLATAHKWETFEAAWKVALAEAGLFDEDGRLLPFYMTDFESRKPPFDKWDQPKRIAVIGRLIGIINDTVDCAFIAALPIDLYHRKLPINSAMRRDKPLHRSGHYMACFYKLHQLLVHLVQTHPHLDRIPLIFDRNKFSAATVLAVIEHIGKAFPEIDARLGPGTFESKTEFVPLQAADILAYEAMKYRDNRILNSGRPLRQSYAAMKRERYLAFDHDEESLEHLSCVWWDWAVMCGMLPDDPLVRSYIEERYGPEINENWKKN